MPDKNYDKVLDYFNSHDVLYVDEVADALGLDLRSVVIPITDILIGEGKIEVVKSKFTDCTDMANTEDVPFYEGVYYSVGCKLKSDSITQSCLVNRGKGICPRGFK